MVQGKSKRIVTTVKVDERHDAEKRMKKKVVLERACQKRLIRLQGMEILRSPLLKTRNQDFNK